MTFQNIVHLLKKYWTEQGCILHESYDIEKGAGTFNPITFFKSLGGTPYQAAYLEPCRRPNDGRYGENPNRLQKYFQYQVILKPSPLEIQKLYLDSLTFLGLDSKEHDIRFVQDDWKSPTLGAWGLGWEVWANGMEISQFTYFQQMGGTPLNPITGEITYGLERMAMYLQGVESVYDIKYNQQFTYGEVFLKQEKEFSRYNFELVNPKNYITLFDMYEAEAQELIKKNCILPAYDLVLKCSHAFNLLEARGAISITERENYIFKIQKLAVRIAEIYLKQILLPNNSSTHDNY